MDSGKKTINHVEIRKILPVQDGYRMPGEYEPHRGCILIWPERPGSWRNGAREAKKAFADVIRAIAKSEEVYLAASGKTFSEAEKLAQRLQTDEASDKGFYGRDRRCLGQRCGTNLCDGWTGSKGNQLGV